MKAYQIVNENGIDGRTLGDIDQPAPKHNKILEGVDHSVEIGSACTLEKPAMATRQAPLLILLASLRAGESNCMAALAKFVPLGGIYIGGRKMFENMHQSLSNRKMKPVVDSIYSFADSPQAYHDKYSAVHFGKLVIEV